MKIVQRLVAGVLALSFSGVAGHRTAELFVMNAANQLLQSSDAAGHGTTFASGIDGKGLAFDSAGNLFVARKNLITKFDPSGNMTIFADSADRICDAVGLAFRSVPEPSSYILAGIGLAACLAAYGFRASGRRRPAP